MADHNHPAGNRLFGGEFYGGAADNSPPPPLGWLVAGEGGQDKRDL